LEPGGRLLQPDILFISAERQAILTARNAGPAPDLVVEVLSPSTASRDREVKAKRYAKFGVREMWLVDPDAHTMEVFSNAGEGFARAALHGEAEIVRSAVLEGLEFPDAPLFRPI
jgi:Uma2 family endonuclease